MAQVRVIGRLDTATPSYSDETKSQRGKIVLERPGMRSCPHLVVQVSWAARRRHQRQQSQYPRQVPFATVMVGDLEHTVTEQEQRAAGWDGCARGRDLAVRGDA